MNYLQPSNQDDDWRRQRAERRKAARAERRAAGISTKPVREQSENAEFASLHHCECGHQRYKHIPACCHFPIPPWDENSHKCQCKEFTQKVYSWGREGVFHGK